MAFQTANSVTAVFPEPVIHRGSSLTAEVLWRTGLGRAPLVLSFREHNPAGVTVHGAEAPG
jgi:hypothetical protein